MGYSVGVVKPATPAESAVKCAPATVKTKDGFVPGSVIDSAIEKAAAFYKIDPYAICAIIKRESGFDATLTGKGRFDKNTGAWYDREEGLMQILPSTAKSECGLDPTPLWDPATNIRCGAKVFARYCALCDNNLFYCFCAYNAGPGGAHCSTANGDRMVCPVSSGLAKPYAYAKGVSQNFNYFKNA